MGAQPAGQPRAHIEVGTDAYDVVARELPADERDATYPKIVELAATFGDYQAKTNRVIPCSSCSAPARAPAEIGTTVLSRP